MKNLVFTIFVLLTYLTANGQNYIGYSENNYSGVHASYANPAYIADNRLLVDVNLGSGSMKAFNDHLYFSPRNMPFGYVKTFLSNDPLAQDFRNDEHNDTIVKFGETNLYRDIYKSGILFESSNVNNASRNLFYNHEVAVLNFMVSLDDEVAFSFGIKQRTFVNVDDLPNELLLLSLAGLEFPELWAPNTFVDQKVKFSFNTWNEYALGLASVIYNRDAHFIKTGMNLKYLQGISAAYFSSNDLNFQLLNADTANSMSGSVDYGYTSNLESSSVIDDEFKTSDFGINLLRPFNGAGGNGFAADLGVVYEWRPKHMDFLYEMNGKKDIVRPDQNKYKLRVALSANDLGGIRYNSDNEGRQFTFNNLKNFDLSRLRTDSTLAEFNENVNDLVDANDASYTKTKSTFFINSPAHVIANVDYLVLKNFYLNANAFIGIRMPNNSSNSSYHSNFSFTPRYEHAYFAAALPISYSKIYGPSVGLSARLGPYVVLGTGNVLPFFAPGRDVKVNGVDLYFTVKVPIMKRVPRDIDGDLVSDKEDLCVNTPGVWQFRGCPDSDNDGVQDSEDNCPKTPGKIEFKGCPDTDSDGIIDGKDDCPEIPGLLEFNGCPDADGDKIIDSKDDCPTEAGLVEFNGCPDSDSDGIKDSEDLCPQEAGPKENNGCPDTDNDGLFDYLDECPTEFGPKENKGCPWPDTDKDGILDKNDKCPLNAGPKENQGCPYIDTDGDGILDKDDACVNVPGVITNMGCPEIEEEEKEILQTAFENLEFETGKAIIKSTSFESLDKLAELLIKKPDWKLKVTGHTDSQGGAQNNLILSKKRAEAISLYLGTKEIDVSARVLIAYFGEEKPIADNATPEGRQANRRVEMDIIFE
ncbi:MAG: DUF5723 family protein [Crocinitomicaceae bacterium]